MEKVWDELKKIEAQAQQIQTDAQDRAKKLTQQAKQDAEKLVANSKIYAEEESQKLYDQAISEVNAEREAKFKASQKNAYELKAQAEKRMDEAVSTIVHLVLEEN
jgi:vacuolar-type H+-ATPase subunit H